MVARDAAGAAVEGRPDEQARSAVQTPKGSTPGRRRQIEPQDAAFNLCP